MTAASDCSGKACLVLGLGTLAVACAKKEWACIAQPVCKVAGWERGALTAATLVAVRRPLCSGAGGIERGGNCAQSWRNLRPHPRPLRRMRSGGGPAWIRT